MITARIHALGIRGFRRFQEQSDFAFSGPDGHPPDTMVVAGPNGSGKSSFFEAMLYALGREDLLHQQLLDEHRRRWLRDAVSPDVEVRLILQVTSAPGTLLGTRAPCRVEIIRRQSGWSVLAGEDASEVSDDAGVVRSLLREIPVEWFSSWRQPYLSGPVRPMGDLPDVARGEAGRLWQVKQRVVNEKTRDAFRERVGRDAGWLQALGAAWVALRGDDGSGLTVSANDSEPEPTGFDLYVHKTVPEFGDVLVCPVDQLSSGELAWLALVGTLITTDFEGIVFVDEPELHMHPEWQARLLPALRATVPNSQIVVASHADPPWDQVYSFERVLLVPPSDPRSQRRQ